jgi:uncharacterized membrane protein YukC
MDGFRIGPGPGPDFEVTGKDTVKRAALRRSKLAKQSWPEFFKGLAIETIAVVILVLAFATFIWFLNR